MTIASFERELWRLRSAIDWAPDWFPPLLLVLALVPFGLFVHWAAATLVSHLLGARDSFVLRLLRRARGATKAATVALFATLAIGVAPMPEYLAADLRTVSTAVFIVVLGWIAVIAVGVAADTYVRRFDISTEDNLAARTHVTQIAILRRAATTLIIVVATGAALMSFDGVREYGISLFASAGAAGLILGFAARPVLANLIAGLQIATTQPIRIDDVLVLEGEWGWVEEIASTYVVVRLWDWRRLIVPLTYFTEKPFQNWTRQSSAVIGTVKVYTDYAMPVDEVRSEVERIVKASPLWDGRVVSLQVTEAKEHAVELRALMSARTSSQAWDLRCHVREKLIAFLQREHADKLPRLRAAIETASSNPGAAPRDALAGS